jgi:hypothetical protein
MRNLNDDVALGFRDQLREARFKAQKDAEAFDEIVFVVERLGCYLKEQQGDLWKYRPFIVELATCSTLFCATAGARREVHTPFPQQYDLVREARNDRAHEGAAARHATSHAIELALVLEDALMNSSNKDSDFKVSDFMVRTPVCASMWHPLSFIRQTMLTSSFSCLPVNTGTDDKPAWELVSDHEVAIYLRRKPNGRRPKDLLVCSLKEATRDHSPNKLTLIAPFMFRATAAVDDILEKWWRREGKPGQNAHPVLVTREGTEELLGILSPYDLL